MSITRIKSYGLANGAVTTEKISNNVSLGVKISNIQIANSAYSVLNDTAIALAGGYIIITGAGFASGCQVIVDSNTATSTTFVNSTTIRAQVGAAAAGSKVVYVVNTDGGTAIRVNGLTYSATPSWVTGSTLASSAVDTAISIQLDASSATTYQLQTGSSLPAGLTLSANGLLSGTVTGIESETTYTFTIEATDAENQESPRTFSLTISVALVFDYLVVAGGGGGGGGNWGAGGGGGAGGFRTASGLILEYSTNYTVTVGAGGAGDTAGGSTRGASGSNSVLSTITSSGGGGGGTALAGNTGGSGGGGSSSNTGSANREGGVGNTPSVSPSQGNNGGAGPLPYSTVNSYSAGGGGGVGQAGSNGTTAAGGNGGNGTANSITGSSVTYAGGGGGGTGFTTPAGAGGTGGGGAGTANSGDTGTSGTANTGGGGGGGGYAPGGAGGVGGSGIVIVKYSNTLTLTNPGGGLTFTTSTAVAGFKITTFTAGTGNIQFN